MAVHARTECCSVCSVESVIVASWTFTACTAHRMHSSPAPAIKYGTNLHIYNCAAYPYFRSTA